ncbi:MAG: hypothetical protein ACUVWX_09260 [Kiritimatiellia bacterium]
MKIASLAQLCARTDPVCFESVLEGEISGLRTRVLLLSHGNNVSLPGSRQWGNVYLVVEGEGKIYCSDRTFRVTEVCLFAPFWGTPAKLWAGEKGLKVLEISVELSVEDQQEFATKAQLYPWFVTYSRCRTYRERIKSLKTVNRTLLPENTFPRLCVGSVETTGPDRVAPHRHPMLEQLFFGLQENDGTVIVDGRSTAFGNYILLHIPLGSEHSVEVAEGCKLHYVWIDLFFDRAGMEWIRREHIQASDQG